MTHPQKLPNIFTTNYPHVGQISSNFTIHYIEQMGIIELSRFLGNPRHIVGFRQIQWCPRGRHRDGRQCWIQRPHQQCGQPLAAVPIVGFRSAEPGDPWVKHAGKWKVQGLESLFLFHLMSRHEWKLIFYTCKWECWHMVMTILSCFAWIFWKMERLIQMELCESRPWTLLFQPRTIGTLHKIETVPCTHNNLHFTPEKKQRK